MGTFVISKRDNGDYKFIFATRRGKTIFTSISYKQKSDCEKLIGGFQQHFELFAITKIRNAGGKYFFRLSKDGFILANSRKYTTELLMLKGINEIAQHIPAAEVLDFSENDSIFPEADLVFAETEEANK
ncbi:DUF1508 domain-containing protein [Flavobacterium sp. CYK-4]|uniref:DUF1508 domain-containing protein n=1 Tax=Flavobacterium lotistagni TaxID=2709660 RepID=UPI00140E7B93|nr:DUF1508 domain-containing protein [Flavobacterium lotistagni]NHM06205.1 DUF1508 domain-containing protein [Flavobacterium lotistagni]